jgi:phage terminase large subunit-like protein
MSGLPPTSCPDWAERLQAGQLPINIDALPVATEAADRLSAILARLRVSDLPNKPRFGDLEGTQWIDVVARAIYGDGTIREALVSCAKKQAKTSHGALIFLAAFLAERDPRQSFTVIAPTIGIASFAFDQIVGAVMADETLETVVQVRRHTREIEHRNTGGILSVKAFSKDVLSGLKGSVLLDEAWLMGGRSSGESMRAQIKGALAASKTSKCIVISTTSDAPPAGSWATMISYARAVRDGEIVDPGYLPVIFEPWPGCDPWVDESVWPKLLPSFPHIADHTFYRAIIREADAAGPAAVQRDKAQFFNVEARSSLTGESWALAEHYESAAGDLTLQDVIDRADDLSLGIDLGGLDDLCAVAVLGTDTETGNWLIWFHTYGTRTAWQRNLSAAPVLDDAVADGDLTRIEVGEDIAAIVALASALNETGKLKAVGIDPAGAAQLTDALEETGSFIALPDADADPDGRCEIIGIGQGAMSLMPAIRTLERRAATREVIMKRSRLLSWMLSNTRLVQRGAAVGIDRESAARKIDAVAAILDAATVELTVDRPEPVDIASWIG